jgi:hypothetical protein
LQGIEIQLIVPMSKTKTNVLTFKQKEKWVGEDDDVEWSYFVVIWAFHCMVCFVDGVANYLNRTHILHPPTFFIHLEVVRCFILQ